VVRYPDPDSVDIAKLSSPGMTYEHERNYRFFRSELLDIDVKAPLEQVHRFDCGSFSIVIGALNSCTVAATKLTEYGFVGDQLSGVIEQLREPQGKPVFRALALHHHVVPIQDIETPTKDGVSLTLDAAAVMKQAQQAGVRLIFHGHQHQPHLVKVANTYFTNGKWQGLDQELFVLAGGSVGADRLPNGTSNTYSILSLGEKEIGIRIRSLAPDGNERREILDAVLPVHPE
jgi:hypothetical protein